MGLMKGLMNVVKRSLILIFISAATAAAQRDSALSVRPMPSMASIPKDSLVPPITPRRAFLYSFLAPGYSQTVLNRHEAAAAFILVEAISIVMIRESASGVHEARRFENDTTILNWSESGAANRFPGYYNTQLVRARRAHVEDWTALLVANHLFAGADAFVAANLWDVPARLGLRVSPNGAVLSASLRVR